MVILRGGGWQYPHPPEGGQGCDRYVSPWAKTLPLVPYASLIPQEGGPIMDRQRSILHDRKQTIGKLLGSEKMPKPQNIWDRRLGNDDVYV